MSDGQSPLARGLLLILMTVGVLGFGAIGLCGGFFTASVLPEMLSWNGAGAAMLLLSLPCLIGGFFMVRVCVKEILRVVRGQPAGDDPS
ncbi:MAG: hypothetical protein JF607_27615 [Burkholderiales bacterium]|jgi:hypothetical protein|nr:hypothetical protein [Burkholderiales bacterium]